MLLIFYFFCHLISSSKSSVMLSRAPTATFKSKQFMRFLNSVSSLRRLPHSAVKNGTDVARPPPPVSFPRLAAVGVTPPRPPTSAIPMRAPARRGSVGAGRRVTFLSGRFKSAGIYFGRPSWKPITAACFNHLVRYSRY